MIIRFIQFAPCLRCSCFNPLSGNPEERPIPELWHCTVNPWASRELRWRSAPKPLGKRKVLVIGGGVSGMYAALTAAERGHDVTLCEKESKLGGQLWFTEIDDHKESLKRYKDSLIERCKFTGVNIYLGTEVTTEFADQLKADVVICAVGAQPFVPPIKGIELAVYAVDAYKNPESYFNKKVVIIGGGAIGCETGYFLADIHKAKIKILEARDDISKDSNDSQRMALFPRMKGVGMTWDCNTKILEITDSGVLYVDEVGNEHLEEADVVLFATGSRSNTNIVEKYREISSKFLITGDARKARTVKQATYEGFCAAMDIL